MPRIFLQKRICNSAIVNTFKITMSKIIDVLSTEISAKKKLVDDWFLEKFKINPPFFYNSVDLRHSGFKIAPIDTNCFPAGFNNLSNQSRIIAKKTCEEFLINNFPSAKNILILPENHTRNFRYFENLLALKEIIETSERHVVVGSMIDDMQGERNIDLENNKKLTLKKVLKHNKYNIYISTFDGFVPDLIILNNDLTDGVPQELADVPTPIIPSIKMGWYKRTKSGHFSIYNDLVDEFAEILGIDSWLISSMHKSCGDVDFKGRKGIECLAKYTDELIEKIKKKYAEYNIKDEPYCYIKADNGTYGMAVMPVFSGNEVLEINKKERNKMNMLKNSVQSTSVMVQEGIKTIDTVDKKIAEPMIYMINGSVVGNLFRTNKERDSLINLNAQGMEFSDLENFSTNNFEEIGGKKEDVVAVYSTIARLAALASSMEI
jgi:glutamate--cysteine ligase